MIPPKREEVKYELVKTGDFITGVIDNIEYDENHTFSFQGTEKVSPAVRLVFKLDEYEHLHRTKWMNFIYSEKSNLYKKFIIPLVALPVPYFEFDIEKLKGMKVKAIWENSEWKGKTYQNIELIRPIGEKIAYEPTIEEAPEVDIEQPSDEDAPF